MAITLSDTITEADSGVIISAGKASGNLLISTSFVEIATEPSNNDILMFADIPSNVKIKQLLFQGDIITTTDTVNIGVYAPKRTVLPGGVIFEENEEIKGDVFATEFSLLSFVSFNIAQELRFELSGSAYINLNGFRNAQLTLWELCNPVTFSPNNIQDPGILLRIGVKFTSGVIGFDAGDFSLRIIYTGII